MKLRATFQVTEASQKKWVVKHYPTGVSCSEKDFARIRDDKKKNKLSPVETSMRLKLIEIEARAEDICNRNSYVSLILFDRLFSGPGLTTAIGIFDRVVEELRAAGQIKTKDLYESAKKSFIEFAGEQLALVQITPDWLTRYVSWMKKSRKVADPKDPKKEKTIPGKALTTISIYLRCLRRIYNDAINEKLVSADLYPFGLRRFVIQSVKKPKTALSEHDKNALLSFTKGDAGVARAIDFWRFSYFCNGMNMNDVARLKVRDIQNGKILFDRGKTMNTAKELKKIVVIMRPEVKAVITRHGNRSLDPDAYVFPILSDGLDPQQEINRIHDFTRDVNEGLDTASKALGFEFRLTTYTARHTFANIAMIKGASKSFIQEALGHQSIMTTENYIAGFDEATKARITAKL